MLLTDTSKLLKKLWKRPAENFGLIVNLNDTMNGGPAVYARSEDGVGGVVTVQEYDTKCASVVVDSPGLAKELLIEAGLDDSWRVSVCNAAVIEMLEHKFGFAVGGESVFYTVDKESFRPCEVDERVKQATTDAVPRLQEFAQSEGDRNLIFWTQEDYESWGIADFYCEVNGDIVGYVNTGVQVDPLWEIGYIYTKPDQRGKGYARMLASAATLHMLEAGRVPIYSVSANNIASAKTCESIGYQVCGRGWAMEKRQ